MITVRPVIIDASVCYIAPSKLEGQKTKSKRKAEYEVMLEDDNHRRSWYALNNREEQIARMAVPGFKAEIAVACDVLFDAQNHPPVGHFHWDKVDISKRIYVHPETKSCYYMLNQRHLLIDGTRIVPKRVTRKKVKYHMDPTTGKILHTVDPQQRKVKKKPKKKGTFFSIFGNTKEPTYVEHYFLDIDGNEVPKMVDYVSIPWLYPLQWDGNKITNLDVVLDLLAQETT